MATVPHVPAESAVATPARPRALPADESASNVFGREFGSPGPARVYDYLLGGKDNYAADRELADSMLAIQPYLATAAWENRAFLSRAVRLLAGRGVNQFIDVGCGMPTGENVHEMALRHAPGARVVYVDHDPIVLAHARALLTEGGNVVAIEGDIRDPAGILDHPEVRGFVDRYQPVAVLMTAILHFLPDAEAPYDIVGRVRREIGPGSALVISHVTADVAGAASAEAARVYSSRSPTPMVLRGRADVLPFFGDFGLVDPGLVFAGHWRPAGAPRPAEQTLTYAGIGIKGALPKAS